MFDKLVADDVPDHHEFSKFYKLIRLANDDVYTYLKDDLDIKLKYDAAQEKIKAEKAAKAAKIA